MWKASTSKNATLLCIILKQKITFIKTQKSIFVLFYSLTVCLAHLAEEGLVCVGLVCYVETNM